jgi:hypothetical protein
MTNLYRYDIPSKAHEGWGIFFVSSDGIVTCVSDYGNYGHRWPFNYDKDGDFREWLVDFDTNYIRRKMAPSCEEDDVDATRERIMSTLLTMRRAMRITRDQAMEWWVELHNIGDIIDMVNWMRETEFPGAWDHDIVKVVPPDVRAFEERLLPRLQAAVRAELAKEAAK